MPILTRVGKVVVFHGPGYPFENKIQVVRKLHPGEILVRNLYTTICGSDIHTFLGVRKEPCPTVLGHEIIGEIVEIDPEHTSLDLNGCSLKPGDRITWSIFSSDPKSLFSQEGIPQKGDELLKYGHTKIEGEEVFHGGLGEYCILTKNTGVFKIPDELPVGNAATINCALATVAGAILKAGSLHQKNVLITGMGMLGTACAAMCKDAGASWVTAADIEDKRLHDSMPFGVDKKINLIKNQSVLLSCIQKFPKKGFDIVFDMSGSADAMELGLEVLAIGGTAVWIGAVFNSRSVQVDAQKVVRKILTIKGLHNYNFEDFRYAFDFIKRNWKVFPFEKVIEKEYDLEHVQEAFQYAVQRKPLRVGIRMS